MSTLAEADAYLTPNYARYPVEFARGEGARLWDADGVEYLDFLTGISVSSVGHCHPAVVAAIREQAGRLLHVGNLYYTEPMSRLARRLAESSLGGKVFFTNSGAEAVEAALKCARKARQGGTIVSLHGAFHGRTYGALSATPQESKQAPFAPLVGGFVSVDPTIEALAAAVDERTAALILEPIQGETGVHVLPDELLRVARERCDRVGATLIFDEIQTGLGRTGTAWAYEHSGVVPDLLDQRKGARRRPADRRADHRVPPRRHLRSRRPRLDVRRRRGRLRRRAAPRWTSCSTRSCSRGCASWGSCCASGSRRCRTSSRSAGAA